MLWLVWLAAPSAASALDILEREPDRDLLFSGVVIPGSRLRGGLV